MTSLSQYMKAEQPDDTEPVTFYAPGARGWDDPRLRGLRGRAIGHLSPEDKLIAREEITQDV